MRAKHFILNKNFWFFYKRKYFFQRLTASSCCCWPTSSGCGTSCSFGSSSSWSWWHKVLITVCNSFRNRNFDNCFSFFSWNSYSGQRLSRGLKCSPLGHSISLATPESHLKKRVQSSGFGKTEDSCGQGGFVGGQDITDSSHCARLRRRNYQLF